MTRITLSARFDSLQNAERAATEVRSVLGAAVDIRSLSENQSDTTEQQMNVPNFFAFPNMNFNSTPFGAAFVNQSGEPFDSVADSGVYADEAYVMEMMIDSDEEGIAAEIIKKYDAELM